MINIDVELIFVLFTYMYKKIKDMNNNDKNEFISEDDINIENMTNEDASTNAEQAKADNLSGEEELVSWEEKYNELNGSYLRLHAEFDNYRKRTLKEKADLIKTAGEKVLVDILPIVDDFERALDNMSVSGDIKSVKEGVELIYNKLIDFLLKNGVKKMDIIGQPFDLDKHEAITTVPATSEDAKDKIIDCIQQGYEMGDKVIRFPKVIVSK